MLHDSSPTHQESQTRKLVVLDLNGTLLVREPLPPRASFPPPRHGHGTKPYIQKPFSNLSSYKSGGGGGRFAQKRKRGEQDTTQPTPSSPRAFLSTSAAPAPIPRKSHLRPYMPSFKSYLSHPSTLAWLDTMIWSSAQPHNVGVMVDEVFGENHEFLKAVWARDTLISVDDDGYRQKSKTTKDLEIVWANPSLNTHSSKSTLLVDDSPLKAEKQPSNHIVVQEYTMVTRESDVASVSKAQITQKPDTTLLSLIGILHTLKGVDDVESWIRQDGLSGPSSPTTSITNDRNSCPPSPTLSSSSSDMSISDDSDSGEPKLWYDDPDVVSHWEGRGIEALKELGLDPHMVLHWKITRNN